MSESSQSLPASTAEPWSACLELQAVCAAFAEAADEIVADLERSASRLAADRAEFDRALAANAEKSAAPVPVSPAAQDELAEIRRQIEALREVLRQPTGAAAPADGTAESWASERTALQSEIERGRVRFDALNEKFQRQTQTMLDERAGLTRELRQMRELVERQSDLLFDWNARREMANESSSTAV